MLNMSDFTWALGVILSGVFPTRWITSLTTRQAATAIKVVLSFLVLSII